ncbi:uncharacterized protein VTP21DRAFT_3840 [Calcarisporiella thermophila]|uniref:uncharacterized protein n=1 Tax=Calcarisporiella thermophila TaxID=911321 RepID=UPI0037439970
MNHSDADKTSESNEKKTSPQLLQIKQELHATLARKKQLDQNLTKLERSIYLFEGSYLDESQQYGNLIRGFHSSSGASEKTGYTESDRWFSLSSTSFKQALSQDVDLLKK